MAAAAATTQWDARRNPLRSGPAGGSSSSEIQSHLAWLNSNLAQDSSSGSQQRRPQSISLQAAVADGLSLPLLVEKLLDQPIADLNRSPLTRAARLTNLDLCVSHLCRLGAAQPSSSASEIMSGSLYQTLNLVRWVRGFCDARVAAAATAAARSQPRTTVQQQKQQHQRQQQLKQQQQRQQQLPITKQPVSSGKTASPATLTRIDPIYQQPKEEDGNEQLTSRSSQVRLITVQSAKPQARSSSVSVQKIAETSSVTVTEEDLREGSRSVNRNDVGSGSGNVRLEGLAKHAVPPLRVKQELPNTPPPPPGFETPVSQQPHSSKLQLQAQLDEVPSDAYQPKSPGAGRDNLAFQLDSPAAESKAVTSALAAVAAVNNAVVVTSDVDDNDEEDTLPELDFSRPGSGDVPSPEVAMHRPPPPRPPPPKHPRPAPLPPPPPPPRPMLDKEPAPIGRSSKHHRSRRRGSKKRESSNSRRSNNSSRRRRRKVLDDNDDTSEATVESFDESEDSLSQSDSDGAAVRALEHRVRRLERHVTHLSQRLNQALSLMTSSDPQQVQLDGLQQVNNSKVADSAEDYAEFVRPSGVNATGTVLAWQRDWPPDRPGILGYMTHPLRHKKLSWFFGSEPPFLRQFLDYLGYGQCIPHFEQHGIGVRELVCIDDRGLRSIGLPKGPRARILQAVRDHLPRVP